MDLARLITLPESKTLEFKQDASSLKPILKTVVAFANTAGGILVLGVNKEHMVHGISNAELEQDRIANAIAENIKPQLLLEIEPIVLEGKNLLVVQIHQTSGPFYLHHEGEEFGVYIRLGATNRKAGTELIAEMKRHRSSVSFDLRPCPDILEKDLDMALIRKTFENQDHVIDTAKLLGLNILCPHSGKTVATNGGAILFAKQELRERYFPYAYASCARFAGTTKSEFIDRLDIEGGILAAIDEVPKFIRRNTRMAAKIESMYRQDIPEYPVVAVREALINALAHANYEVTGTRFFVAIFDDRLEIQNPGILPLGMSIEEFKAGVSRIRNPVIAGVFRKLSLIEEWGSGYKRIKEACQKGDYPEPTWEELGVALRVTFYPHIKAAQFPHSSIMVPGSRDHDGIMMGLSSKHIELLEFCTQPQHIVAMMEKLELKNRAKFRLNYITPLLERHLLTMTLPNTPKSKQQKYVITDEGQQFLDKHLQGKK